MGSVSARTGRQGEMNMNPATIKMMCGLRKGCIGCKYEYEDGKCRLNSRPCFWKIDGIADATEATEVTESVKTPREVILDAAKLIVTGERGKQYGRPEDNFGIIAKLWEVYLTDRCVDGGSEVTLNPEDVAIMMSFLKIARIMSGDYVRDSFIDACGYLALAGEMMG